MCAEALLEPSDEEVLPEPSSASVSDSEESQEDDRRFSPKLIPPRLNDHDLDDLSDASDGPGKRRGRGDEEEQDPYDWGPSRKDYYNADPITTEADALEEEAEARRLQKKQLERMTDADFGLDEIDWAHAKKEWMDGGEDDDGGGGKGKVISEVLPKIEITESMGPEEKMQILRVRYPEFEPLAKEYLDLHGAYEDLSLASKAASAMDSSTLSVANAGASTIAAVKLNALGGYLAALCMYFALLSATDMNLDDAREPMPPAELHEHKIMDTLVKCRQLWEKVKDMEIPEPVPLETNAVNGNQTSHTDDTKSKKREPINPTPAPRKRKSRSEKKAAHALAAAKAEAEARRQERLRKTEESLKDLSSLTSLASHPKAKPTTSATNNATTNDDNNSDLGDPTALTPQEAAQKAARKKSLRFYTSQIAQKSNKRGAAGRDAGGDADIPHQERIRDRQARLNAEAEARGRKKDNSESIALDANGEGNDNGSEAFGEQMDIAREVREDQDEDYYDLVASHSKNKKLLKSANAQAAREGGVVRILEPEEGVGADGKRGITYAIEKNKGLAPKRRKEVRNPRVKKRKKFEDKKKKLGSVRAVYKGGEGRGGYKGELTGIKSGLVKSVKL